MTFTVSHVLFIVFSAVVLVGAVGVVSRRNLFWAALFLVLSFVGVAGYYILLEAEFLAMIQLLIYVGAIAILIIFAVMLTPQIMSPEFRAQNEQWLGGLLAAAALFAILAYILVRVSWPTAPSTVADDSISRLGQALVSPDQYALPFEVASLLLLAALVGAVLIARDK